MKRVIITEQEKLRILGLYSILTESIPQPPTPTQLPNRNIDSPGEDWEFDKVPPPKSPFTAKDFIWPNASPGKTVKLGLDLESPDRDMSAKEINIDLEFFLDNLVDIISAALEGIPGIGNLGSAIVDIAHSLSFFVRAIITGDEGKRFEYVINGLTTGFMAAIPLAGNVLSLGFRSTYKLYVNMTHSDVITWLLKYGIRLRSGIYLKSKSRFVYVWLAAIKAYIKDEGVEFLTQVENYAGKGIGSLETLKGLLNTIKKYSPFTHYYIKAVEYVIDLFKQLKDVVKEFEPIADKSKITQSGRPMIGDGNKEAIIIVGSYKDENNFYSRGNELIDMGYKVHTSKTPDGNSRLGIIVKYNNDVELNSALDKIKKEVQPNAWILK